MQPSSRLTHQSTRRAIPTFRSITKPTTTPTRTMSLFTTRPHSSSLSPSSPFTGFPLPSEFGPMFKLMDDYASHVARRSPSSTTANSTSTSTGNDFWSLKTFTPKFDVKEEKDRYVLEGELPGIEQKDLSIEFTGEGNGQTLVVRGRTERVREEGTSPAGLIGEGEQQGQIEEGDTTASGYHKPSVQDEEGDAQMSGGNPDAEQQSGEVAKQQQEKKEHPTSKYWISERSVGEFSRSFAFPARVDQENVKASLKNGVLSIVVPKAAQRGVKRIAIE